VLQRFLWKYEKKDYRFVFQEHVQKKNLQVHGRSGTSTVHEGSLLKTRTNTTKNLYFPMISILGIIFLIFMIYYSKNIYTTTQSRNITLLLFIFICLAGMIAALYPSRCKELSSFNKKQLSKDTIDYSAKPMFSGHHPECDVFNNHTFKLLGKKLCAGCSGLFSGAFFAVAGTLIYYFNGIGIYGPLAFWTGTFMVLASLVQLSFLNLNKNWLKFVFNFVLVFGSFLIIVGINEINGGVLIDAYFLLLVIIWIMTRIWISEDNHATICYECQKSTCNYR